MLRTVFAIAVAGLIFTAVSGTAQAAQLRRCPRVTRSTFEILSDVQWRRCWRDRWGRLHCRRCWRDRWGRFRCW